MRVTIPPLCQSFRGQRRKNFSFFLRYLTTQ